MRNMVVALEISSSATINGRKRTRREALAATANSYVTEVVVETAVDAQLVNQLVKGLEQKSESKIRSIRSAIEAKAPPGEKKCKVNNLNCVKFPTTKDCKGIGVGGCFSIYFYKSFRAPSANLFNFQPTLIS